MEVFALVPNAATVVVGRATRPAHCPGTKTRPGHGPAQLTVYRQHQKWDDACIVSKMAAWPAGRVARRSEPVSSDGPSMNLRGSERALSSPTDSSGSSEQSAAPDTHHRLRAFYLASGIGWEFGYGLISLASYVLVYNKTKSVAATGLIMVAQCLPQLLLPSVATRLSRRWGAPTMYVVANTFAGVVSFVPVLLSVFGLLSAPALIGWFVLLGTSWGIGTPTVGIVRILMAPPGRLAEFNGQITMVESIAGVAGFLVGALAYDVLGATWVFLIGAVVYFPCALAVNLLRREPRSITDGASERFRDFLTVLRTNGGIRAACYLTVFCFVISSYVVVLPALGSAIGSSNQIVSILEAASMLGGLFVGMVIKRIRGRIGWDRALTVSDVGVAITLGIVAVVAWACDSNSTHHGHFSTVGLIVATLAITGASLGLFFQSSILAAVVEGAAPAGEQAAVLTGYALISLVAFPIGQELIGLVCDVASLAVGIGCCALGMLLLVLISPKTHLHQEFDTMEDAVIARRPSPDALSRSGKHASSRQSG